MSEPRLASSVLVSALIRHAEGQGGFASVLAKGDQTAGAVSVILREKGGNPRFFERLLEPDGRYRWRESVQVFENEQELETFLKRRQNFDPDSWILELDIASAERFAAEMNSVG
jgi:hypothetical protein